MQRCKFVQHACLIALMPGVAVFAGSVRADEDRRVVAIAPLLADESHTADIPAALRTLIETQHTTPDAQAMQLAPPGGLDTLLLGVMNTDVRATMTLDEALDTCRLWRPVESPERKAPESAVAENAARLGVRARTLRERGEIDLALKTIRNAARLDPTTLSLWRELGAVYLAHRNLPGALVAFQRAYALDARDEETMLHLGFLASTFGEYEQVAAAFANIDSDEASATDPALPYLVPATLGRALLALGYVTAAAELLDTSLALPERLVQPTAWADEFMQLARARASILVELGDALVRIEHYDHASMMYDRARRAPGADLGQLLQRQVFVDVRRGSSGNAAARVIAALHSPQAATSVGLVSYVARGTGAGLALREAIESDADRAGTQRIVMTRARAAAQRNVAQRAGVLGEHISSYGPDWAVVDDLRETLASMDPADAMDAAAEMIRQSPQWEPWISGAMPSILHAPEEDADAAQLLMHTRQLERAGKLEEALRLLDEKRDFLLPVARLRALTQIGGQLALGPRIDELLDAFVPSDDVSRLVYAEALAERGRTRDALRALAELIELPPVDISIAARALSLGAELRAKLEQWPSALDLADRALALDPLHEPAHALRLDVLGGRTEAANTGAFGDAVNALRDVSTKSALLDWLRAMQAKSGGQGSVAQESLLALASDTGVGARARAALTDLWIDAQQFETAGEWTRRWMAEYPAQPSEVIHLAHVLVADRRGEAARLTLTEALRVRPGDDTLLRTMETLIRTGFITPRGNGGNGGNANNYVARRLANAPPTLDTFIDRARVASRRANLPACQQLVHEALQRADGDLSPSMTKKMRELLLEVFQVASQRSDDAGKDAAILLFDEAMAAAPGVGSELYGLRLQLYGLRLTDPERYFQAAMAGARMHPAERDRLFQRAVASLTSAVPWQNIANGGRKGQRAACSMMQRAVAEFEPPAIALYGLWLQCAAVVGEHDDVHAAVSTCIEHGVLHDAIDMFAGTAATVRRGNAAQRFAQMANQLALSLHDSADDLVVRLYEESLRVRPNDPETCNSYGYRLLELDRDIDRALGLIIIAITAQPNAAHITDSMGWALYKVGRMHDDIDPDTGRVRSGAVVTLQHALLLVRQGPNAQSPVTSVTLSEVTNHLGDALWAANDRDGAIVQWTEAVVQANRALTFRQEGGPNAEMPDRVYADVERALVSATQKLAAARTDQTPAIARIHRPVNAPLTREQRMKAAINEFPEE